VRSELVYALVDLDKRYANEMPSEPWPQFYARDLAARFANHGVTRSICPNNPVCRTD
jgi:hypothetical protein